MSEHHRNELNKPGLMRLPEVLRYIPVGRSTWWKGIKEGRFPKGVKLGPRTTAWRRKDISDLLDKVWDESHPI